METIASPLAAVTAVLPGTGPSVADLDAIEREMPLILAEVELLDVQIMVMDRAPSELDERRVRRARNRVMAARRDLSNRTDVVLTGGAA